MSEPVRFDVEIGGVTRTLVCKPWPYREGRQWLTRMLRLLAPLAESGGDVGIGGLFEQMTDDFMDGLLDACEQHTEIVTRDSGRRVPRPRADAGRPLRRDAPPRARSRGDELRPFFRLARDRARRPRRVASKRIGGARAVALTLPDGIDWWVHRIASSRHYPGDGMAAIVDRWTLPDVAHAHGVIDALDAIEFGE